MTDLEITCPNCQSRITDPGDSKTCPFCGVDLLEAIGESLSVYLEAPDALQDSEVARVGVRRGETAPLSEFIAAGAVLLGILLLVAGVALSSQTLLLVGVVLIFGVTGVFAIFGGAMARTLDHARTLLTRRR